MILQALCEYYQRKASDPENGVAPEGLGYVEIPFLIRLDSQGNFIDIEDTRVSNGKILVGKKFLVLADVGRTRQVKPNRLWDKADYSLGLPISSSAKDVEDAHERHSLFVNVLKNPKIAEIPQVKAVLAFFSNDPIEKILSHLGNDNEKWKIITQKNSILSFIIDDVPICSIPCIRQALLDSEEADMTSGICLITGEQALITKTHPKISNVSSKRAAIVSFNEPSFSSFKKEQNLNAPVSKSATFTYTEALNMLLDKKSRNKMQVGDMTMVFWSEKPNQLEDFFSALWSIPTKDNPDADIEAVRKLYSSINTGVFIQESNTRFYLLGLSPNSARIAIRYWQIGTIDDVSKKIKRHFDDLKIATFSKDKGRCALMSMLGSLVRKLDDLPPNLCGDMVKAAIQGTSYPQSLLQLCIRRTRTDFDPDPYKERIRMRAALLKAFLNRNSKTSDKEITVSLDTTNQNIGYLLGRLFAALEKLQEEAQGGNLNSTIKDRYYGAASSTPCTVFPQLFKLKNFHLAKLSNPGRKTNFEKLIGGITEGIPANGIPAHLNLDDQARFAIGYYHQRQDFFKTKEEK